MMLLQQQNQLVTQQQDWNNLFKRKYKETGQTKQHKAKQKDKSIKAFGPETERHS